MIAASYFMLHLTVAAGVGHLAGGQVGAAAAVIGRIAGIMLDGAVSAWLASGDDSAED
jgi:uncharacterized membrane protein